MRDIRDPDGFTSQTLQNQVPDNAGMSGVIPDYLPAETPNIAEATAGIASGIETDEDRFRKSVESATKGRAPDIGDPLLAMQGIVNGDPVGMETFDLGFFEDGTPAININGGAIPINQAMWMAILQTRIDTRDRIEQEMQHRIKVDRTKSMIDKIFRASPNLSAELRDGMSSLVDLYPDFVGEQAARIGLNSAFDNNRTQANDLRILKMETLSRSTAQMVLSPRSRPVDPNNPEEMQRALITKSDTVEVPSLLDAARSAAFQSGRTSHAAALGTINFFLGGGEKHAARAARGLTTTGLWDITSEADGNSGESPAIWWFMQIASDRSLWGQDAVDIPNSIANPTDAVKYMDRLNTFAAMKFGYGPSDPFSTQQAYDWIAKKLQGGNVALQQQMGPPPVEEQAGGSISRERNPKIAPATTAQPTQNAPPFSGQSSGIAM